MEIDDWSGLISPDAYEYLDLTPEEDLLHDSLLDEQDLLEEADEEPSFQDNVDNEGQGFDDSDLYAHSSLFDEIDDLRYEDTYIPDDGRNPDVPDVDDTDSGTVYDFVDSDDSDDPDDSAAQMPELIAGIVSMLPRFSACASYLKECGRYTQEEISRTIKTAGQAWKKDRRDKMFTIPGTAITVALVSRSNDPMTLTQRLESVGAVMLFHNAGRWTALFLTMDEDGLPAEASVREVSESTFSQWEWKTVTNMAQKLKNASADREK